MHFASQFRRKICVAASSLFLAASVLPANHSSVRAAQIQSGYLGFDSNDYPGDEALRRLRRTFSFAGYWLNSPPGTTTNEWSGKRAALLDAHFGFLVLFNGRSERELHSTPNPATLGAEDGASAVAAAKREQFPVGAVIFLDQEEGGRLLAEQMTYVLHWINRVARSGYKAGVYCSGIPVNEGTNKSITTAEDIRSHAENQDVTYFVYNDACPPSSGCVYPPSAPAPSGSGVKFASVWQFAQSPRRREYTARCASTYNRDGNCYPPESKALIDLDAATSPDPSNGR